MPLLDVYHGWLAQCQQQIEFEIKFSTYSETQRKRELQGRVSGLSNWFGLTRTE